MNAAADFEQTKVAFTTLTGDAAKAEQNLTRLRKFAGMMDAQSNTTKGLFSTLKDAVNGVFLALVQPINDVIRLLVAQAIGLVFTLTPLAAEAGKRIREAMSFVMTAFKRGKPNAAAVRISGRTGKRPGTPPPAPAQWRGLARC